VFHRSFDKDGKENYVIDGAKVSLKAYIERIRTFKIQVDNLCMFLPQDRVQDFTKLNSQELLHNTQISVCSEEINKAFDSLKKKREQQKAAAKHNAEIQVQLTDNMNRNEQLHQMIENNRTKEKLMVQRDLYQKKKAWLEYDDIKKRFDEVSGDIKTLQELLTNKRNELKPLERKQQEIAGAKTKLKNNIITLTNSQNTVTSGIDKMIRDAQKINSEIRQSKQEMQNIIQSSRDHEKEVQDLKLKIRLDRNDYEKAQQELQENENMEASINEYDQKLTQYKNKIDEINRHRQLLNARLDEQIIPNIKACERKIRFMTDTNSRRFETLRHNFEDAHKASEWLRTNREKFNGHIFNPILTEITVTDKKYAKYIENCVGNRDFETFLCTDKADMSKLIKILRDDMKLNVNIGFTESSEDLQFGPQRDITEFPRQFGIYAYVIDMIEGPAPVLNYLCKLYSLHNIVVGDDSVEKFASQLPNDIKVFFSTNSRFQSTVSRYTGVKSVQSNDIMPRNILDVGVDQDEINAEHQK
jgi:chromosome segregation ATPase